MLTSVDFRQYGDSAFDTAVTTSYQETGVVLLDHAVEPGHTIEVHSLWAMLKSMSSFPPLQKVAESQVAVGMRRSGIYTAEIKQSSASDIFQQLIGQSMFAGNAVIDTLVYSGGYDDPRRPSLPKLHCLMYDSNNFTSNSQLNSHWGDLDGHVDEDVVASLHLRAIHEVPGTSSQVVDSSLWCDLVSGQRKNISLRPDQMLITFGDRFLPATKHGVSIPSSVSRRYAAVAVIR